jgi:hypothetical protein
MRGAISFVPCYPLKEVFHYALLELGELAAGSSQNETAYISVCKHTKRGKLPGNLNRVSFSRILTAVRILTVWMQLKCVNASFC